MTKYSYLSDEVLPDPSQASSDKYVVLRNGHRVSDAEYEIDSDPECLSEFEFWSTVAKNNSRNEIVRIARLVRN
jgi:hypothetical protein